MYTSYNIRLPWSILAPYSCSRIDVFYVRTHVMRVPIIHSVHADTQYFIDKIDTFFFFIKYKNKITKKRHWKEGGKGSVLNALARTDQVRKHFPMNR